MTFSETMKNIYLTGFMGTGKTTIGKILAKKLNLEFVEMDQIIEQREGQKIVNIFAEKGENYFRDKERALLEELSLKENLVISCGGGLICNEQNLNLVKNSGIAITLNASVSNIYERTKKYTDRPLLNVDNPLKKIAELLNERTPYYEQAHHIINTDNRSTGTVVEKILFILKNG